MEENKYERMLAEYNTNINDEEVARKVKRIVEDKVEENNTLDVKKFLFGSIELTSLKATDSDESILKLVENVNKFEDEYMELPHVATICVYP